MSYALGATGIESPRAIVGPSDRPRGIVGPSDRVAIPSIRWASRTVPRLSYRTARALGAVDPAKVRIGHGAERDPIIAFSSVVASNLILQATRLPRRRRLPWLRSQLDTVEGGLGVKAVGEVRRLRKQGVGANQALFDGLRLTIANKVAKDADRSWPQHSAAGLGDAASDTRLAFCLGIGTATAIGAGIGAFTKPEAGAGVTEAGSTGASIAGCDVEALNAQVKMSENQLEMARLQAEMMASQDKDEDDNTLLYVALGGGALLLLGLGVVVLKK